MQITCETFAYFAYNPNWLLIDLIISLNIKNWSKFLPYVLKESTMAAKYIP